MKPMVCVKCTNSNEPHRPYRESTDEERARYPIVGKLKCRVAEWECDVCATTGLAMDEDVS